MTVEALSEEVSNLKCEIERLHGIIRLMKRDKFGLKSERVEDVPPEQLIFNEIEKEGTSSNQPVVTGWFDDVPTTRSSSNFFSGLQTRSPARKKKADQDWGG